MVAFSIYAQKPAYTTYTMEDGLPSNWVYDIIQSKDGAIWFATDNGVARFDGYKFNYFGIAEGLPHPDVFVLHEDDQGRIWCGVMNNELCFIKDGKVIRSKHAPKLSHFFNGTAIIQGICVQDDELYIAYSKNGLIHIDSSGEITRVSDQLGIHVFLTGSNENLVSYLSFGLPRTRDVTIFVYNKQGLLKKGKTRITKSSKSGIATRWYAYGGIDSLQILSGNHNYLFRGNEVEMEYPKERSNQIVKSQNWIWNGSETGGILLSNSDSGIERTIFHGKNLTPKICDVNGNVWVVEIGKGVYCFKPVKIRNYINGEELHNDLISTISSQNGRLAIGYESGWVEYFAINQPNGYWLRKSAGYLSGIHWLEDKLYVQSTLRLERFNKRGEKEFTRLAVPQKPELMIRCSKRMLHYKPSIYSFVGFAGICLWSTDSMKVLFNSSKSGPFRLQDQLIDNYSNIWTTSEKGIYLFDLETEVLVPYVENISVSGIVQLDDGAIWCSDSKGGIVQFIPSQKKTVSVELGEIVNQSFIKHLRKDKNGIVWGTSNKGLFKIDPRSKKVELITKSDGLLSNLLTDISIDDEFLYVCTSKGISSMNINESFTSTNAPILSITQVKLNGSKASERKLLNLDYDENNLEFRFVSIGFETPGAYHYRYRLKGLNNDWQYTSELKALFLSVPDGSYQFELETYDPRGGWSVRKTILVRISPVFWKTWWFILGSLLLIVFSTFLLYKRRVRKLKQTNRLKNEIKKFQQHAMTAQMNPHFIFNSMNSIQRFILENERLLANEYLVKFSGLMRLTLENSKKIWVPIDDELASLKLYLELETLRFKSRLIWKVELSEDMDTSLKIPTLLIQPFVENSIWHGLMHKPAGGFVAVTISKANGNHYCEIVDNGIGRAESRKLKSKEHTTMKSTGVSITQRRLELLHSQSSTTFSFKIEDRKDDLGKTIGTRVYFSIPTTE